MEIYSYFSLSTSFDALYQPVSCLTGKFHCLPPPPTHFTLHPLTLPAHILAISPPLLPTSPPKYQRPVPASPQPISSRPSQAIAPRDPPGCLPFITIPSPPLPPPSSVTPIVSTWTRTGWPSGRPESERHLGTTRAVTLPVRDISLRVSCWGPGACRSLCQCLD